MIKRVRGSITKKGVNIELGKKESKLLSIIKDKLNNPIDDEIPCGWARGGVNWNDAGAGKR